METGTPFDIETAWDGAFYAESTATIKGDIMTLLNHVQMANVDRWTRALKTDHPAGDVAPAYAAANIADTLTVNGAEGVAWLLPIYELDGRFASSSEKYLESFVALCPGIPGTSCRPKLWRSKGGVADLHEFYQPTPIENLQFRFGEPFQYVLHFYSRIMPPGAKVAETLPGTFRDDETVDFTLKLLGVSITDANGDDSVGATIVSESGVEYNILPHNTWRP
jgi:hypothetical protein